MITRRSLFTALAGLVGAPVVALGKAAGPPGADALALHEVMARPFPEEHTFALDFCKGGWTLQAFQPGRLPLAGDRVLLTKDGQLPVGDAVRLYDDISSNVV